MHGVDKHVVNTPGINTDSTGRNAALSDLAQTRLELLVDTEHIPTQGTENPDHGAWKAMNLFQSQPATLEARQHHASALCAQVASDIVVWPHGVLIRS